jgi:hypothetical protein
MGAGVCSEPKDGTAGGRLSVLVARGVRRKITATWTKKVAVRARRHFPWKLTSLGGKYRL